MVTLYRPRRIGLVCLASLAMGLGACADAATLPASAPAATPVAAGPTLAPTPAPTLGPTAAPAAEATAAPTQAPPATAAPTPVGTAAPAASTPVATAAPTPTPAAAPAASASPAGTASPPAPAATTVEDYAWVYDKHPLTLRGTTGTTRWTKVLFAAKTVNLKWSATPATSAGCSFRYKVESRALARPVAGTQKVKGSKAGSGSRSLATRYGDGVVTVNTTCAKFTLRAVSTSHPGLTISQSNDPYKATGTTASDLNEELANADASWSINTHGKYYSGSTVRVASFGLTMPIDYELPKWKPPSGTDPALVASWKTALANMRRHIEGEAAIGIQAGGRYLAAATRRNFSSVSAMNRYYDKVGDAFLRSASDRTKALNKATGYGYDQGAFIPE